MTTPLSRRQRAAKAGTMALEDSGVWGKIMLGTVAAAAALAWLGTAEAQTSLKMNGMHEPSHPASLTHEYFADRVAELTDGEIQIEVHHSRALGDAVESVQSLRNGTIAFFDVSASNLNQVVPEMDMLSLPYLFKNAKHYWWYLNSERAEEFVKPLEDKGIVVLGYIDSGARSFFTQKPIRSVDDLQGQKIRTMASPVAVAMMEALGGTGVPIAWGELYNALGTGVVDGAENNHPSLVSMKFYEVSKYYTVDEHARIPDVLVASKKVMDQLTEEQQEAVKYAGKLAQAYMRGAWAVSEQNALAQLESLYTEIIEVDKQPFIDAVSDLVNAEAERLGVTDEVNYILEEGKRF
jgi:tripartite ATP-independent transporter DctP family solute receptor